MSQFPQQPMPGYGMKPATPTSSSGKAIASLILGLLSFCALIFTGIPAIILGFMALSDIKKSGGRVVGQFPAIAGLVLGFLSLITTLTVGLILPAMLLPAMQQARDAARGSVSRNNLKDIGLALHNYHIATRAFPMAGSEQNSAAAATGSQLSWRVHILPYLNHNDLYQQFHMDEPWDSPHNKSLIDQMPAVFQSPASGGSSGKTSYLAVVMPAGASADQHTVLMREEKRRMSNVIDGTSNTIMVIDAGPENAVEWTRPADYEVSLDNPKHDLEQQLRSSMSVLFADGSVRQVSDGISDDDFRWLLIADDGHAIGF